MSAYRIELTPDDDGSLMVTCPALPEVTSFGATETEAVSRASAAVEEALAARIAASQDAPADKLIAPAGGKLYFATIPAMTDLKVQLYRACRAGRVTRAELARRLGWNRTSVDRLFLLDHNSRLEQIEAAAGALGLTLRAEIALPS
jgi:antitoxin HicB